MNNPPSEKPGLSDRVYTLFVLGPASVRMTRVNYIEGSAILTVHGPGAGTAVYTCGSHRVCVEKQAQIEASLSAAGYSQHPDAERRTQAERRRFPRGERRRRAA